MSGWVMNDPRMVFREDDHSYWLGNRRLPSVTQILGEQGIADFNRPHFTEDVKERGRLVHKMIALDVEEALDDDTVDPFLQPYLDGWRKFLAESGAIVEFWERPCCDPDLGFAGTLDGIVMLPNQPGAKRRTVLDVKRALYASAGPQVSAYARCARALYDKPVLFDRKALVLPGDGSYKLEPLTDSTDEHTFLAALRCYHWRRRHGVAASEGFR